MHSTSVVIADRHPVVLQGLSNKEIGRRLNITDGTIKVHLHTSFRSLKSATGQFSRRSSYRK
jgi:DNA-directed RNA polymerase specialized sigma24 family protein